MHIQTRLDPQILDVAKRATELEGSSLSEYLRKLAERNLEVPQNEDSGDGDERESGLER